MTWPRSRAAVDVRLSHAGEWSQYVISPAAVSSICSHFSAVVSRAIELTNMMLTLVSLGSMTPMEVRAPLSELVASLRLSTLRCPGRSSSCPGTSPAKTSGASLNALPRARERKAGAAPRLQNSPMARIQEFHSRTCGSMSSSARVLYLALRRYALTHSGTQYASL